MTIIEILEGSNKGIIENINLLRIDYLEKTGKKLNTGCPSCVREMILTLKHFYNMTQFKFKRNAASYKNAKGDRTTISNSTMTDKKAIEFLKTNPKRISLFSEYPSNWKKLIDGKKETAKELKTRLAIEAELAAQAASGDVDGDELNNASATEDASHEESDFRYELDQLSLKELRARYPEIKATSTKKFVDKVLAE